MGTDKPKIQGYVEQQVFQAFHGFQLKHGMSQSQALEALLIKALELDRDQDGKLEPISQSRLDQLEISLDFLRNDMYELINQCVFRLEALEAQTSNLNSNLFSKPLTESLPILEAIEKASVVKLDESEVIQSNLDGDTPNSSVVEQNEPEVIQSNLDGDTPNSSVVEQNEPEVIQSNLDGDTPNSSVVEQNEPEVIQSNLDGDTLDSPVVEQDEGEDHLYMICRYNDISPDTLQFWNSRNGDFSYGFESAKRYQSEKVAHRQMLKLLGDDRHFVPDRGWQIKLNSVGFFKKRLEEIREKRHEKIEA